MTTSDLVPGLFPVALDGQPLWLDLVSDSLASTASNMSLASIPLLRTQSDNSTTPGEHSINPDDLWRRSRESWHHGAGQTFSDRNDSDEYRFHRSFWIDPWNKWQVSLLNTVTNSGYNVLGGGQGWAETVGSYLYVAGPTSNLAFTQDISTSSTAWTTVTDTGTTVSVCSDGTTLYLAKGSNGVYTTSAGGASTSSYATGTVSIVRYVNGRLMAADGPNIYNITGSGSIGSALFTHDNSNFQWMDIGPGDDYIYATGYAGDKSLIYKIGIKDDGSGLSVPVIAGRLPDGEIAYSLDFYLGFVLIGTSKGVRLAVAMNSGSLNIGPYIPTDAPVRCFEGQDRFVWFGWSDLDATPYTFGSINLDGFFFQGLGRLDLTVDTSAGSSNVPIPAYATDLMTPFGQGALVTSVVTFQNRRVFTLCGSGNVICVNEDTSNSVPYGFIDSGIVSYGLPDNKVAVSIDTRTALTSGGTGAYATYRIGLQVDDGGWSQVEATSGSAPSSGKVTSLSDVSGERFEVRYMLIAGGETVSISPHLYRWTMRSNPTPARQERIVLPVSLAEHVEVRDQTKTQNPLAILNQIRTLTNAGTVVTLQLGDQSYSVIVEDYEKIPAELTRDGKWFQGRLNVQLKTVA